MGLAQSRDITLHVFLIWGYFNGKVYTNPIDSEQHLHEAIVQEFNNISVNSYMKAWGNVSLRLHACVDLMGAQIYPNLENRLLM